MSAAELAIAGGAMECAGPALGHTFADDLRAKLVGAVAELRSGVISRTEILRDATVGDLVATAPVVDGGVTVGTPRELGIDWHMLIRAADGKPLFYWANEERMPLGASDSASLSGIDVSGMAIL